MQATKPTQNSLYVGFNRTMASSTQSDNDLDGVAIAELLAAEAEFEATRSK